MQMRWYLKGRAIQALNNFGDAVEAFNRALEIKPDFHGCALLEGQDAL